MLDLAAMLDDGRASYAREAWLEALGDLSRVDREQTLGPEDLERMARSAYMLGRDDEYVATLERAHHGYRDLGLVPAAVRCTFWIGHSLLFRGQAARADGWFARGGRLLDAEPQDCVERGYLMIPLWLRQMGRGDWDAGYTTAGEAAVIAERFGDTDLLWLARDEQGRALVKQGRVEEGLELVNEVLVVVSSGTLSPVVSGIVYCNTIDFCRDANEIRHTREWTDALSRWCDARPEMVAHNGLCLVHRAEMMQVSGEWTDALAQAELAAQRFTQGMLNQIATGKAHYRQGEIHRLQGRLAAADECYRDANRHGCEPIPGMALLRLAQGHGAAAEATIRRAVAEHVEPHQRAALLPAYVEIMLAQGDLEAARRASDELAEIVKHHATEALEAAASFARGDVALAAGDVPAGLTAARTSWRCWHDLDAPYEAARARVLVGIACRALGDEDSARLELEAAREVFASLSADQDLASADALLGGSPRAVHGLTGRELEVLRLVVSGLSNREIAEQLVISQHTVARHLQNIFTKLGVSSRTAASTFAFEHDLV